MKPTKRKPPQPQAYPTLREYLIVAGIVLAVIVVALAIYHFNG